MSYSQLSSCAVSVASLDLPLDQLQRVLLKLEGGEPQPARDQGGVAEAEGAVGLGHGHVFSGHHHGGYGHGHGHSLRSGSGSRSLSPAADPDADMVATAVSQSCRLCVDRPVYQQAGLQEAFCSQPPSPHHRHPADYDRLRDGESACGCCSPREGVVAAVPALRWLRHYDWHHDLVKDTISGCTVAVMNIPQGMAYALLGNVPPVVGIYMAIFPALVYAFLGTSRHVAMGSFAVICLMTGKVVSQHATVPALAAVNSTSPAVAELPQYTPLEVATAVTFMVAIYQLFMYVFRMGIMCSLLSDTLVNGFTAGAAIHVFTSQIKDLLGMQFPKYNGNFQIIYTYISIFQNLSTINIAATVISAITVTLLVLDGKFVKPWVSQRSVLPVPSELIAVTVGTVASTYWDIQSKYHLSTVGHISIGLPEFQAPNFQLLPTVALDSFVIAVIAYIISMSMALIFAQMMNYEINPNQELLAQGAGNLVGSFLSCMPFAASLSRSMIQQTVGGRTQLASIISAMILSIVLVSFGPVFQPLPRCILASLIIVALKGVLFQVKDIVKIWRMSALDGIVWICTYLTVIFVEIDIGLLVGLVVSILTILFRGLRPNIFRLSRLPNTDIYVESARYGKVEDINGICMIHYAGGLNFANRGCFKQEVLKIMRQGPTPTDGRIQINTLPSLKNNKVLPMDAEPKISFLILDLSGMQYTDPSGAAAIQGLAAELAETGVTVCLAGASGSVGEVLDRCGVLSTPNVLCFPTVHDAVVFAQSKLPKVIHSIRL